MLTLWAVQPDATVFDRHKNVGLHHLAIATRRYSDLTNIYQRIIENGIEIEFAPTEINGGSAMQLETVSKHE